MIDLFYDDALPEMVRMLRSVLSIQQIQNNLFLRDPSGRLAFIAVTSDVNASALTHLSQAITKKLAPYVDDDGFAIATPEDLFDDTLTVDAAFNLRVTVDGSDYIINMIDRRIIGTDWLQAPAGSGLIPRIVFASLKGGVGRSTALCVAAAALAADGRRVLAIDMDVEAPGLGSMLLSEDTLPPLGLLDYLVETNFGRSADDLFDLLASPSWLSHGAGVIDVIPALGLRSLSSPQSVLSKVSRAYVSHHDSSQGVTQRMQQLLEFAETSQRYDVILIDARAGLHETTGAALLGFGAQLLMFGTYQPQTFRAYRLLFANLAIAAGGRLNSMISIIHAKASFNPESRVDFAHQMRNLLIEVSSDKPASSNPPVLESKLMFDVDWETDESILEQRFTEIISEEDDYPAVVHVLESEFFRDFDPLDRPDTLTEDTYRAVYGAFVDHVFNLVDANVLGADND